MTQLKLKFVKIKQMLSKIFEKRQFELQMYAVNAWDINCLQIKKKLSKQI